MTEARYTLVGFIDTAVTKEVLKRQFPWGVWRVKPKPEMSAPDGDIVLVLHVSQFSDDGKDVREYACFNSCVEALAQDSWDNPQFADHLSWIKQYGERIKAVVLTSGGYVSSHEVAAARQKLEGRRIEVFGWNVRELASRLKQCSGFLRTSEFLSCLAGDTAQESALRLLSALLPFGLLWEANRNDQREGLIAAAQNLGDDLFSDFERLLVARFKQHLSGQQPPDWEPSGFEHNAALLNDLLSRAAGQETLWAQGGCASAPTELDSAIRTLAESGSLDLWNERLTALRDSLLEPHG